MVASRFAKATQSVKADRGSQHACRPPQYFIPVRFAAESGPLRRILFFIGGASHDDGTNDIPPTRNRSASCFDSSRHPYKDCRVPGSGNLRSRRTARSSRDLRSPLARVPVLRKPPRQEWRRRSMLVLGLQTSERRRWQRMAVLPTGFFGAPF